MNSRDFALVRYVLNLMELDNWFPRMADARWLRVCHTHLERMYALGLLHDMERRLIEPVALVSGARSVEILDPWLSFRDGTGPSTMTIAPQAKVGGLYRDFVICWDAEPVMIIETDGFRWHRDRRNEDRERDATAPIPTLRLLEEVENPKTWGRAILDADWSAPCTHCGVPILGEHSPCPPF